MSGWFPVERDLFEAHPFFDNDVMSEREAWIWMRSRAAWEDTRHKVGKTMMDVPRGSFMATLREMQSAFMWRSDTKVRNFLARLEAEGMIERTAVGSRNASKTHVTICDYEEIGKPERTKNAPKTHRERTENAVKKEINNKEGKSSTSDALAVSVLSEAVSQRAAEEFAAHRRDMKKPLTERAARAMVKKLANHPTPDAVLNDSIANGWQGIFPEKTKPQFTAINGGQNNGERPSKSQRRMEAFIAGARGAGGSS